MRRSGEDERWREGAADRKLRKKEQKEWLDSTLPDPNPCTAGNKEEEHNIHGNDNAEFDYQKIKCKSGNLFIYAVVGLIPTTNIKVISQQFLPVVLGSYTRSMLPNDACLSVEYFIASDA